MCSRRPLKSNSDSWLLTPDFLIFYENTGLYRLAREVVKARAGIRRKAIGINCFGLSGGAGPLGPGVGGCVTIRRSSAAGALLRRGAGPPGHQLRNGDQLSVTTLTGVRAVGA